MSVKKLPEDAFFDNLTMGLITTLSNIPRVSDIKIEKRQPCEKAQIHSWEQRHCVYLPEDMKKFYLSTDGFILHWSYEYSTDDVSRVGCIHFPFLCQITLLRESVDYSQCNVSTSNTSDLSETSQNILRDMHGHPLPKLSSKSKIFEINEISNLAKVCLVYESTGLSIPKIYLLELSTLKWQFLADTFSEYLRMAIAHLGLPYWELCFSSFGLPAWTEQLFLLIAPHLLEEKEPRRDRRIIPADEHPYSILDSSIFRGKSKNANKQSSGGAGPKPTKAK